MSLFHIRRLRAEHRQSVARVAIRHTYCWLLCSIVRLCVSALDVHISLLKMAGGTRAVANGNGLVIRTLWFFFPHIVVLLLFPLLCVLVHFKIQKNDVRGTGAVVLRHNARRRLPLSELWNAYADPSPTALNPEFANATDGRVS